MDPATLDASERRSPSTTSLAELATRVEDLAASVAELERRGDRDLNTRLADERDGHRAEAATMREAAVRANAAARDVSAIARAALSALEAQTQTVSQLLAPATPRDAGRSLTRDLDGPVRDRG